MSREKSRNLGWDIDNILKAGKYILATHARVRMTQASSSEPPPSFM